MLDLNELSMFIEVVKAGTFAEAARRLGMPPSRLSRRVQQLEDALGTRLLSRSTRKLSLTAAGSVLYERCLEPLDLVRRTSKEIAQGAAIPQGLVRVSAPANFLDFFPMKWIKEFLKAYPSVQLELMLSDANVDLIEQHIDVGLRDVPAAEAGGHRRLFAPMSTLVASPAYIAERGQPDSVEALAGHDCLALAHRNGPRKWKLIGPAGRSEIVVAGPLSANNAGAALQAAIEGLGITLLPVVLTASAVRAGLLVPVLPGCMRDDGGLRGGLFAVLPAQGKAPAAVSAFIDFAAGRLAALDEFSMPAQAA
jgi:DNA-binding transcriptional LysR family regulator